MYVCSRDYHKKQAQEDIWEKEQAFNNSNICETEEIVIDRKYFA